MRQFAAQKHQAEKAKMKVQKDKIMQEIIRELHIIQLLYKEVMKGQRQGFQIKLECIRGKLEEFESRSKLLENKVKVQESPGQQISRKTSPIKVVLPLNSGIQDEGEKRQTSKPESLKRSQTQQQIKTLVTKASTPNQLKQTQSRVLRKSYAQVTKKKLICSSSDKSQTKMKYVIKKRGVIQNQAQR